MYRCFQKKSKAPTKIKYSEENNQQENHYKHKDLKPTSGQPSCMDANHGPTVNRFRNTLKGEMWFYRKNEEYGQSTNK